MKAKLRVTAARNGVSMEEQARRLLTVALADEQGHRSRPLGTVIHELFANLGGDELASSPG